MYAFNWFGLSWNVCVCVWRFVLRQGQVFWENRLPSVSAIVVDVKDMSSDKQLLSNVHNPVLNQLSRIFNQLRMHSTHTDSSAGQTRVCHILALVTRVFFAIPFRLLLSCVRFSFLSWSFSCCGKKMVNILKQQNDRLMDPNVNNWSIRGYFRIYMVTTGLVCDCCYCRCWCCEQRHLTGKLFSEGMDWRLRT